MAMNLGISSYCLCKKLYTNEMTMFDILDWAKENGCTHLEICPFGLPLMLEDGKTLNIREASFFATEGPRELSQMEGSATP